jgi:digeranylgeranylglycerophospholipid reductase
MRDVLIVGGGPAGLSAASQLAAAGHDVALFEEHDRFGDPVHCTGVLAAEAIDELGVPREVVLNPLTTARFFSPSGLDVAYTPATPEAVVIDRLAFDASLARVALGAGATIEHGTRIVDVEHHGSHVAIRTGSGQTVRGRSLVLACGANYALQRRLGLGSPRVYLSSAQAEAPASRGGEVELFFGGNAAPRGFAWAVPVARPSGPHVRIGLMCSGNAGGFFRHLIGRAGPAWGVSADEPVTPRRRLLPLSTIRRTYADRVVAIGDAAGLVKPTTGGGIYYSIVSARIAAEVLTDRLRRDDLRAAALAPYELQWRARLAPEFRAQLALRMLAQRLPDSAIDALFELARTDGIMPIVRRTVSFNRHRDLIAELFRHPGARRILFRRLVA